MKKLLIIFSLFVLTLLASGQGVMMGVVGSKPASGVCIGTQNLVIYSEQINNGAWVGSDVSVTATNSEVDLEGNTTMETLTVAANFSAMQYDPVGSYLVVSPNTTYRWSFDVKRGTMSELKWSVFDRTNGANIVAPTSYYAQTSATVQRVSLEFTAPAGCTSVSIYFTRDSGTTGTFYVGRAQVETNGSCYIETTSTIITP